MTLSERIRNRIMTGIDSETIESWADEVAELEAELAAANKQTQADIQTMLDKDERISSLRSLLDQIQESRREGFNAGIEKAAKLYANPDVRREIRKLKQD